MYQKHRFYILLSMVIVGSISWFLNLAYEDIASHAITVVSIAIAIHLSAITMLGGSKVALMMQRQDYYIKTKTQLGVFVKYIYWAIASGIACIIESIIVILIYNEGIVYDTIGHKIFATIGFALFALTFVFMWLIFRFMAEALIKETQKK